MHKLIEVRGIMLAISIELDINVISKTLSILMPRLNRATNTKIHRQVKNIQIILSTHLQRLISRAIVNHNVVVALVNNAMDSVHDVIGLVISRYHNEHPWIHVRPLQN